MNEKQWMYIFFGFVVIQILMDALMIYKIDMLTESLALTWNKIAELWMFI